ncbi:MAG: hypothetical protein ACR2FE_01650 [Aeromicrobium sp.]
MKRREGRSVPLQELLEEFLRERPPAASHVASYEEWKERMYLAAADAGYTGLEVLRAGVYRNMRPRPAPGKKRPS